jgi:hypothetical protein
MHIPLRQLVALVATLLGSHAAMAATATVTVSAGQVSVSPSTVGVSAADKSVTFQMGTTGYVITSINVSGGPTRYSCSIAADGASATCRKGSNGSPGDLQVSLTVQQEGGKTLPTPPNIWIQNQ